MSGYTTCLGDYFGCGNPDSGTFTLTLESPGASRTGTLLRHDFLLRYAPDMARQHKGAALVAILALTGSCSKHPTEPAGVPLTASPTAPPQPVALTMCCSTGLFLVPEARQLSAKATYEGGRTEDVTAAMLNWRSSNLGAATVNAAGLVQSAGAGTPEIRATYAGIDVAIILDVRIPNTPFPPSAPDGQPFYIYNGSDQVRIPTSRQMVARYKPGADSIIVTDQVERWWSENTAIATVSSTGLVQPLSPGWAPIHAIYKGWHTWWTLRVVYPPLGSTPRSNEVMGTIQEVTATDKIAVADAQVEVVGGSLNGLVTTANDAGSFRIDGFSAPDFELVISRTGYQGVRYRVTSLGVDLTNELRMTPDQSLVSESFQGEICSPTRTVTTTFTPAVRGLFRATSSRSASFALYVGETALPSPGLQGDIQLAAGTKYELRLTGSCGDFDKIGRLTYLRPR